MSKQKDLISQISDYTFKEKDDTTSKYFQVPIWKKFYNLEKNLNNDLTNYNYKSSNELYKYNPIEYAANIHCDYLRKYLNENVEVLLIGMNPGPNGMAQNGVPFGNVGTVKKMRLSGTIKKQSFKQHPKRQIKGLDCTIEEPSGLRLWNLLIELSGGLEIFSKRCFVHNFCPIAFFDNNGRNITPSELKNEDKINIRNICLNHLREEIKLLKPKIIIPIGSYVSNTIKVLCQEEGFKNIDFFCLDHPSPRSVGNKNWPRKARSFFEANNLIKYLKNE